MIRNAIRDLLKKCARNELRRCVSSSVIAQSSSSGASYDMAKYFKHSAEDGFVRTSSFAPIELPNMRIDQFVWKDYLKWQDKIAVVSKINKAVNKLLKSLFKIVYYLVYA